MDTNVVEEAKNVYAIFRSAFPIVNANPKLEEGFIQQIVIALNGDISAIADDDLYDIVKKYISERTRIKAMLATSSPGTQDEINTRILSFFKVQSATQNEGIWKGASSFFGGFFESTMESLTGKGPDTFEKTMSTLVNAGIIDAEGAKWLVSLFVNIKPLKGLAPVFILLALLVTVVFGASGIMMGDFVKLLKSKFTPEQLGVGDLIRASHIAPELNNDINKKLSENGLSEDDIKLAKISAYSTLDVTTIMQCFLRKDIKDFDVVNRLEELGFTPKRIQEIMSTWEVIPSPQDLLWMVGKEAFEPDQVRKFGLDEEFPSDQVQWLKKQGLSEYWAKKYWAAHWQYPGESRALELFHRGIINDADLDAFYRVIEMPTYWREKLKQASYSLYTRVDLRRMHDMGIISEEDVYTNFRGEGYDDIKARNMTLFYLKYNELNDKDLSMSQIKNAYKADLITKLQAVNALTKLQYTEDQANFILEYVEYEEMIEIQKLRIKSIAKMYREGFYDKQKTKNMLSALGVELKWVDVYLVQWDEEKIQAEKIPDKNELIEWFSSKQIDGETFVSYMRRHGYSDTTIALYIKVNSV